MKILIIRFSSLGDIILTTPFLKACREKFPDAHIDYCVKSSYAEILKFNPNINQLIIVDDDLNFGKLKELRKVLTSNSYDLVIDLHNNLRTFYLKIFLGWKSRIVTLKKYSFRKFLLVKFKINLMKKLSSISEQYKMICGEGATASDKAIPEIYTNDHSKASVKKILLDLNLPKESNLICLIPSSKHFTKTYPPEYFVELINKFCNSLINYTFLLVGKGEDKKNIEMITEFPFIRRGDEAVYDLCGKLNLLELTELMKKCKLVISGDTGPMHIAEALNIPLIMIAGSSVREFGFFPVSENSIVVENKGLNCRPCSHIGRDKCPLGHFKCMRELKPDVIYLKLQHKFLYS